MMTYDDARAGAELVRREYEAGDSTSTIDYQLRVKYPSANGFERNRMIFRGVALWDNQIVIRAGSPPLTLTAPFPTPPSTGPSSRPNEIRIVAQVLIETAGSPDKIRMAAADGVSGQPYSYWADQIEAMRAFWEIIYGAAVVTVTDPARYIY
jgi:hypothetical protein